MSIQTELDRIIALRDELRIRLRNMGLVSQDADLEECVYALRTVDTYGHTFTPIESFDEWITISPGYYPEGRVVGIARVDQEDFIPDNIRSNRTVLGVEGSFTSDATAKQTDILEGKTAYADGTKITGSLRTQAKSVTPTKETQIITPDGGYLLSSVVVSAVPGGYFDISGTTAMEDDVRSGMRFVGRDGYLTTGTMPSVQAADIFLDADNISYAIPKGYHTGNGTVSIVGEERSAVPAPTERTFTPSEGKVFTSFTVRAIPSDYADVSGVTLIAAHALAGGQFVNSSGTKVTGSMPNKGRQIATIDGLDVTSYTIPEGYHNGQGTVSLTDAIETALAEI